ncbi:MAG: acyl-CoA thioesterase [Vampirovibrionales bacterium]
MRSTASDTSNSSLVSSLSLVPLRALKPPHAEEPMMTPCQLETSSDAPPIVGPYYYDLQVPIGETDSYGVAWHGSYTRWLEEARVAMLWALGVSLEEDTLLYPVKHLSLTYHQPIRALQWIRIEVRLQKEGLKLVFRYKVFDLSQPHTPESAVHCEGLCHIVPVEKSSWRPSRHLSEPLHGLLTLGKQPS